MISVHPHRLRACATVATLALFSVPFESLAADQCGDVLRYAGMEQFTATHTMSLNETAHHFLCAKKFDSSSQKNTFTFNLPLPDLGMLGFGADDASNRKRRSELCFDQTVARNGTGADTILSKTVVESAVTAWRECVASEKKGLTCTVREEGDPGEFILQVLWAPSIRAEDPSIDGDAIVKNATCGKSLPAAKTVLRDKVSVAFDCTRSKSSRASVTFNTSQGSLVCSIPPAAPQAPTGGALEGCVKGIEASCLELEAAAAKKTLQCKADLGKMPNVSTQDQVARAAKERECGNETVNAQATMTLIENVRQQCSKGADTTDCKISKTALSSNTGTAP